METQYLLNFINNSISAKAFYVYFNDNKDVFRKMLPAEIFDNMINKSVKDIELLRTKIKTWYKDIHKYECECKLWNSNQKIPIIGNNQQNVDNELEILKHETPWLYIAVCKKCKQPWFVAFDTVDDDYYLQKISTLEMNAILINDKYPRHFADNEKVRPDENWFEAFGYKDITDWKLKTNKQ